jgi:hypothetical protein
MTPHSFAERMRAVLREMATAEREPRMMHVLAVIEECLCTNGFSEGVMVLQHFIQERKVPPDEERRQIEAWRRRAEELRGTADQFRLPSAQEPLQRTAANLDKLADHAEAMLTGKSKTPGAETG